MEAPTKPMVEPKNMNWLDQVRDDAKYITLKRLRDQKEELDRRAQKAKKGAK